ncbi:MAG TPA: CHAP domain-containing protein [Bacilli bacterium]|nr:CHAP domain-containing protein [Bacilli bacterium]
MNFCDYHFLEGVRIAKYFITVLKILIPVILIILGSVNLFKSITDPDSMMPAVKKFGISVASAAIIFFLPTIINVVFSITVDLNDTLLVFNECIKNANSEYISVLKKQVQEQAKESLKKNSSDYEVSYSKDALVSGSSKDVLSAAEKLWENDIASGKFTSYGGVGSMPPKGTNMDCSGYISWVLYEYGYTEDFSEQKATGYYMTTNFKEKYGWEEISVAAGEDVSDKLQPGDILVRDNGGGSGGAGHMNITVEVKDGNVYAYDCGDTKAKAWNEAHGEPLVKNRFAKEDIRPGKIIRVTTKPKSDKKNNNS